MKKVYEGEETFKISKWILIILILITGFFATSFYSIESGSSAVKFKRIGGGLVKHTIYQPGIHIVAPWDYLIVYDTRIIESFETFKILSSDEKELSIELSYRYKPIMEKIGYLHEEIGPEYGRKIVQPEIKSITYAVIGDYRMEEILSAKREEVMNKIYFMAAKSLKSNYIYLEVILIKSIQLSEKQKRSN